MKCLITFASLSFALVSATVSASPILIANTGAGISPGIGAVDTNWTVTGAFLGSSVINPYVVNHDPVWHTIAGAQWISPFTQSLSNISDGQYSYKTHFSLAGLNPATAHLNIDWLSDNYSYVFLNGVNVGNNWELNSMR